MTHASAPQIFPSLFADRSETRAANFGLSFLAHGIVAATAMVLIYWVSAPPALKPFFPISIEPVGPITFSAEQAGGHGGGGDRSPLPAPRGAAPELSLEQQLAPPEAVPLNPHPLLPEPPSVMALSAVPLSRLGQLGDPFSAAQGPASNGPGGGGGIGTNCCGGVGHGPGPGFGEQGPGYVFKPGVNGVTAPKPIYDPEPEYSEEARKLRQQGTVVLWLVVGTDGRPNSIRVQRSLGMGLDEKAIDAVKQWKFQPAMLNGKPVAVQISVELSFRLY